MSFQETCEAFKPQPYIDGLRETQTPHYRLAGRQRKPALTLFFFR